MVIGPSGPNGLLVRSIVEMEYKSASVTVTILLLEMVERIVSVAQRRQNHAICQHAPELLQQKKTKTVLITVKSWVISRKT